MTSALFNYVDLTTCSDSEEPFIKPWTKVDDGGRSFAFTTLERPVENIRGNESQYSIDNAGFSVYNYPAEEKDFTDDEAVRKGYYNEVDEVLKAKLENVKKVVIFDHTIRRRDEFSPRKPVQQVHVDQTTAAAIARVRRHLQADEAEELLKKRYQIINVWRPIGHAASDFPLAVLDYRTTKPEDFVKIDLLYPTRGPGDDDDDRGKEKPADQSKSDLKYYSVKGETMGVCPSKDHRFCYLKDMTPDEVMFIKCFDSTAESLPGGVKGRAKCTPHSAFSDPQTPANTPGRQSIEVRCLVFYN